MASRQQERATPTGFGGVSPDLREDDSSSATHDLTKVQLPGGHQHANGCCQDSGHKMPSIFDAVKSGVLVAVQTLVEMNGVNILHTVDELGHYPAHWACLKGEKVILQYIIDMKGSYNDPSQESLAQRPIHWAASNGHVALVDILLQLGVGIDVTDNKGCTPLIIAAQFGHNTLVGYLIGKGAAIHIVDKEGDTALHWAAFKGHNELMRLLIYFGFNPNQEDGFGQKPIHLACINGNLTSVKELCELDNVDMTSADKRGKTPMMLAIGRKHDKIVNYLQKESKKRASILPQFDLMTIIFGPPGNTKCPILFIVVSMICWAYPMYIIKCIPVSWNELQMMHMFFIGINVLMWISFYASSTTDPGFLPRNTPQYDEALLQVSNYEEWKHGTSTFTRLCHTCRTVKLLRSKHCRICNRCVEMFDHHCPYIYNCVGLNNRVWFFSFAGSVFVLSVMAIYFCAYMLYYGGWDWFVIAGMLELFGFGAIGAVVFFFTLYHIMLNVTTNERINRKRYTYLQDGKGQFYNPYNRGFKRNFLEYVYLQKPLSENDVEFLNVTIV